MDMGKVLIADADEDYRLLVGELIEATPELSLVGSVGSTAHAMEHLLRQETDLLLVDLLLPGGDGVYLLKMLKELPVKPSVVVNTSFLSPVMASCCGANGVDVLMQKPCEGQLVVERLLSVWEYRQEHMPKLVALENTDHSLHRQITQLMQKVGFSSQYKGYDYLRQVLIAAQEYGHVSRGTLKMIYADAARVCNVSTEGIERAIRTMIKKTSFEENRLGFIPPEDSFTNLEMIAMLTEYLMEKSTDRRKIV